MCFSPLSFDWISFAAYFMLLKYLSSRCVCPQVFVCMAVFAFFPLLTFYIANKFENHFRNKFLLLYWGYTFDLIDLGFIIYFICMH